VTQIWSLEILGVKQLPTHQLSLPMTWYIIYHLQPDLKWRLHSSQGSTLILLYHKKPFPKPLQFECAHNSQKTKHTLQRSLRPLMGGQKVKILAEFFMVDARILYVLVVKISDFFYLFWNLCAISKVALVVFLWLIFKLDFDLDDDLIWI
jgi:hypothetical protein